MKSFIWEKEKSPMLSYLKIRYTTEVVLLLAGSLRHPILALVEGRQCTLDNSSNSCALCENTLKTSPHQPYPCSQNGKAVWIQSKNHSLPTSSYSPDRLLLLLYLYRQPSGQGEILTITARINEVIHTTCRTSFKTSPHQLHWTLFWYLLTVHRYYVSVAHMQLTCETSSWLLCAGVRFSIIYTSGLRKSVNVRLSKFASNLVSA